LWQEADFDVDHVNVIFRRRPAVEALGNSEEVMRWLERETGLIQRGQEGFTFVHRSLWEYFTALALRHKNDPKFVIRQAANPDWEEVVRLYAGLLQEPEREHDLVNRLWTINRPLALRVTTETRTPAAELLQPLIAGEADNRGKMLLINALQQSLDLVSAPERANLVQETLRILLIECRETDCEVIFQAQELLEKERLQPLDGNHGGLIHELFDLAQAAARQERLMRDPANHFEWVEVEGGNFQMGDDQGRDDEKPVHPVKVDSFYMAKHPVTNRLLTDFPFGEKYPDYGGGSHPAVGNTWFEAYYFALWVGARLPTEAEWEYATRGGKQAQSTQYYFGDNQEDLADHAWFGESDKPYAHAVDKVNPRTGKENLNPLGLANMHGNVWEWVEDDWHNDYEGAPDDGRVWVNEPRGADRVFRGGGWGNDASDCRSADRDYYSPDNRGNDTGFRLARSVALGP
jgi:formylglycine-generating enzyme required for sulfatase activity